ncbi:MAG: DUF3108 domain-containing protein [Gemmatimonadales bacterium]|nr:DUF3108 domain-containing protein [Gemmatimonadales bacterium]MYG49833.1 DUF3108 domain-containing protein [Gemmatimonadales bacterium]MYK03205.1 DUF3108 domain-containing protein [Candidatus Palauibacter ramosifaciens]
MLLFGYIGCSHWKAPSPPAMGRCCSTKVGPPTPRCCCRCGRLYEDSRRFRMVRIPSGDTARPASGPASSSGSCSRSAGTAPCARSAGRSWMSPEMPKRRPGLATVFASVLSASLAGVGPLAGQAGSEAADGGPFPGAWPFAIGQEAEYAVTFGPVRFGRMHLRVEAQDTIRSTPAYRIAMEMKGSIPFYRMDDRSVSWLATEPYRTLRFEEILHQGDYRRHQRWELDHDALTATREDWDEEIQAYRPHRRQRDLPIPQGALDEISYLFLIRTLPFAVGQNYEFDRYFEEDGNPVIVEVLRRERVRVPAGTFETFVVRPIIQTDGLFGEEGQAEVFISDDDRRLIVQIKSRMRRGSVNMYLRDFEQNAADADR